MLQDWLDWKKKPKLHYVHAIKVYNVFNTQILGMVHNVCIGIYLKRRQPCSKPNWTWLFGVWILSAEDRNRSISIFHFVTTQCKYPVPVTVWTLSYSVLFVAVSQYHIISGGINFKCGFKLIAWNIYETQTFCLINWTADTLLCAVHCTVMMIIIVINMTIIITCIILFAALWPGYRDVLLHYWSISIPFPFSWNNILLENTTVDSTDVLKHFL